VSLDTSQRETGCLESPVQRIIFSNCTPSYSYPGKDSASYFLLLRFQPSSCSAIQTLTFGDAERVVTACYEIVKCNKEIGIALSCSKQVLLGAPSDGFIQCLGFNIATVGAVQGL